MTIGVIGLGRLGHAMAKRLVACGHNVVVWNRTEDRAFDLGAALAASPADLAADVDTIPVSLFDSAAVEAVMHGPEGLLSVPLDGKVIVDTTTHHPSIVLEVGAALQAKGALYLEAPVIGSVGPAENGTLTILASGDGATFERALPLLEQLGQKLVFLGVPGAATRMKLANNLVLASVMTGIAEGLALAECAGIRTEAALDVLALGAGGGHVLGAKREMLKSAEYAPQFSVTAMHKDLACAEELAESLGQRIVLTPILREIYGQAVAAGQGDLDFAFVAEVFRG